MDFKPGILNNRTITKNEAQFSLFGMVSPTFQNGGTNDVIIDGRKLLPGESYVVDQPGIILTNTISIVFAEDIAKNKSNILYVGFVTLAEQ